MKRSTQRPPALGALTLLLAALLAAGATPLWAGLLPGVCDRDTVLTFVGLDTSSGTSLFLLSRPGQERPPALLEVPARGGIASYHRPGRRLFGGSVGPGPVLAFERCGELCLQPHRWRSWAWTPVGGSVEVPAGAVLHATYDLSGAPWLVLLEETARAGRLRARAWRLEEGPRGEEDWRRYGPLTVDAVGQPAAVPDPLRERSVLVGSGRFTAEDWARSWLPALPDLPRERMAEVFPLVGEGAAGTPETPPRVAVLTDDGEGFVSEDGGESWKRAGWEPPSAEGPELTPDRPVGDRTGAPGVVWHDARAPRPALVLTELGPEGWRRVARVPREVAVPSLGETLSFEHFLRPDGEGWLLLTGCVDTPETSGLVARGPGELDPPRFLSIATP